MDHKLGYGDRSEGQRKGYDYVGSLPTTFKKE